MSPVGADLVGRNAVSGAQPGEGAQDARPDGWFQSFWEVVKLMAMVALTVAVCTTNGFFLPLAQRVSYWAYVHLSDVIQAPIMQVPLAAILLLLVNASITQMKAVYLHAQQ